MLFLLRQVVDKAVQLKNIFWKKGNMTGGPTQSTL